MLSVKVKLYGAIKDMVDDGEAEFFLPPQAKVRDLVASLVGRYGSKFAARFLTSEGRVQSYVRMFVNGTDAVDEGSLETALENGNGGATQVVVYIVPSYAAG